VSTFSTSSRVTVICASSILVTLDWEQPTRSAALAEPTYTSDEQRDDAVAAKSERQAAVLANGGLVTVVLAEAVLHQQVGGPDVMTDQLTHLAAMAADIANITVQVMPYSRGAHAVSGTGPAGVARHISAFTLLRTETLTPEQSRQLITDAAAGYSSYGIPGLKASALIG
jgi:hypothetical protein